jgi:hypothetical protein
MPETTARKPAPAHPDPRGAVEAYIARVLRKNLGADVIVLGSYALLPDDGKNRCDSISGFKIQRRETIAQEAFTGDQNEPFDLAGHAGDRLRAALLPSDDLAPGSARAGTTGRKPTGASVLQ